ncbi:MAG: helix-turn-helix domain-containing protein [Betaproteobacteria bacterium]|nr:helix-turn-helix domain-containing protein [Betaproteobacteria bacterium]
MAPADTIHPQYLSLAEAGAIASFSTRTLRRAIAGHKLQAHHVGRNVRIELAELRRWIEADGAAAIGSCGVAIPASSSRSGR